MNPKIKLKKTITLQYIRSNFKTNVDDIRVYRVYVAVDSALSLGVERKKKKGR